MKMKTSLIFAGSPMPASLGATAVTAQRTPTLTEDDHGEWEPSQFDYQARIMQWFGHCPKGEPTPDWISCGVPYITPKDRLKAKRPIG